jgi:hypothetical protein
MSDEFNAETAYASAVNLIRKVCWRFQKRYGGDINEIVTEGNFYFMEAFLTHDPSKGTFSKRVAYIIWQRLSDHFLRPSMEIATDTLDETAHDYDDTDSPLAELSDRGRTVVRLIVTKQEKNRNRLARTLMDELNWTPRIVAETFSEIEEAIA